MDFSHKNLCNLAVTWLRRPASRQGPGCTVAISETANSINGEIPDAIGWRPYAHESCGSVVVEVKVSRSDFLSDSSKNHRQNPDHGMGSYRYFMALKGIIQACELPRKWGLIEINERGHLKVLAGHVLSRRNDPDVWRFAFNQRAEISTLAMCLNRVGNPQEFQDRMREMANTNARLTKAHDKLKSDNERMRIELFNLRNPSEERMAKPRMTHV